MQRKKESMDKANSCSDQAFMTLMALEKLQKKEGVMASLGRSKRRTMQNNDSEKQKCSAET